METLSPSPNRDILRNRKYLTYKEWKLSFLDLFEIIIEVIGKYLTYKEWKP